jgi:two-component system sensor histidine kinase KdpD
LLKKDWHSVAEIVGAAIHDVRKRLQSHPVKTRLPQDLPLVHVDALALEQVLANLLENAAAYTPRDLEIEITASARGNELTIGVADHGPGLPAGDPNRVFQKFFRGAHVHDGKSADNGSRHGVGLGLAICKGIIELHQGTITAENKADGGALFRIKLPTGGTPPPVPAESDAGHEV